MIYRDYLRGINDSFELHYKYSDIFAGFGKLTMNRDIFYDRLHAALIALYDNLESYISEHKTFKTTLEPWEDKADNDLIAKMIKYTSIANVGPMASVAGVFADEILDEAEKYTDTVFIENGGDIALMNEQDSHVMAYSGNTEITKRIILKLPPGRWGVASSSGRFGHSLSFGQADLVTIVAENAARADSFATAIANRVVPGAEPEGLLAEYSDLNAVLIIWNGKMWYKGEFELLFD